MHISHSRIRILYVQAFGQLVFIFLLFSSLTAAQIDSKKVPRLIDQLRHSEDYQRRAAAEALGNMEERAQEAVPYLIEALKDPAVSIPAKFALVRIGDGAMPQLIEALKNPSEDIRSGAASTIGMNGERAKEVVPHLIEALKDPSEHVRREAAGALGLIGTEEAVPHLIEILNDSGAGVQMLAINSLMRIGNGAVPQLIEALKHPTEEVRNGAVQALEKIAETRRDGAKEAVPQLIEVLKDPAVDVRRSAAKTLGWIREGAKESVPHLIQALKDTDTDVRRNAAVALGMIGKGAEEAVPHLIESLKDPDYRVRYNAALAIGRIGVGAKEAVPHLIEALKNPDESVRYSAAEALAQLSTIFVREKATELSDQLRIAAEIMRNSSEPEIQQHADRTQQASDLLKLLWWEQLKQWVAIHPTISLAIVVFPSLLLVWLAALWLRPLWLLRINEALAKTTDVKLPEKLGGFNVALRYLILVGFFHYQPRVLDAWVAKYIRSAHKIFSSLPTVEAREIYVPLPVVFGNEPEADFSPDKLRPIFSRNSMCLLVWGEGGAGKTALTCRLARWAMSPQKETRLRAEHPMLPVLIEQDLVNHDQEQEHPLFKAIKQQVKVMINEDDPPPAGLLRQLLKKRRVLVIIDGFSEMNQATRTATLAGITDLPINTVIITSRTDEQLIGLRKTEIKPLRVRGNRLSTFMEAYLTARKKRDLFEDDEFFEACRRLSLIVGDRDITALLAKLYAEQMIALKEGTINSEVPENIPQLMLTYLNDLCGDARPDDPDIRLVHRTAKSIAWECLRKTLRPTPAQREDVLLALGGEENGKPLLNYLEERLKVIQTVGAGRDRIRFGLDPLAEYLAGMHLVDKNSEDEQLWHDLLTQADEQEGALEDIKGFLLAIRDCCLAKGEGLQGVADELSQRAGVSPEEISQYRIERRIKQLIPRLRYSEAKDRINAAEELGKIGDLANIAVKDLCLLLRDQNKGVRESVALALGEIGEGAEEAVPYLMEALKDPDSGVRKSAAMAIGKIRVDAKKVRH